MFGALPWLGASPRGSQDAQGTCRPRGRGVPSWLPDGGDAWLRLTPISLGSPGEVVVSGTWFARGSPSTLHCTCRLRAGNTRAQGTCCLRAETTQAHAPRSSAPRRNSSSMAIRGARPPSQSTRSSLPGAPCAGCPPPPRSCATDRGGEDGDPVLALIREPREAILSQLIREPGISLRGALVAYARFYSSLMPQRSGRTCVAISP